MLNKLKINIEPKKKDSFWPSDYGKPILDIYYAFKGIHPSNPVEWYNTLRWGAGKGVENAMMTVLKDSEIVRPDYNQAVHGRIEIKRGGVQINGYIDALTRNEEPIEIKSINNKNSFDIRKYEAGEPKENYVGQLAIYMDALGVDTGHLFVSSVDGLSRFWFECKKVGDLKYKCANVEIDLDKEYKKWARLWDNNIQKDIEPQPFEYVYKIPVEEIDWTKISKTDISKARNDKKVIGDWQITYSPYKDLIIERQGVGLGYSKRELEFIREKTKGFTTWN